MSEIRKLIVGILLLGILLAACGSEDAVDLPTSFPTNEPAQRHLHTFNTLWEGIEENYLYFDFGDTDPVELGIITRRRIEAGLTDEEFELLLADVVSSFLENTLTYRVRADRIEADLARTAMYEGIGAFVSYIEEPVPHVVLLAVMPDSPAERAGLLAHESILGVDGIPISRDEGEKVIQRVRGPSGTPVILDLRSPDGARREVEVIRRRLAANDQLSLRYFPNDGVGYFLFPVSAGDELADLVLQGIERLEDESLNGLIVDLRVAHSSANWPIGEMLSLFGSGQMGAIYSREGPTPIAIEGRDILNSQSLPLAILIGPDTQGASEIFAEALQATGRAVLIGQPSPGSVVNFNHIMLPDGSDVFYALSSYQSPDGRDISLSGVHPNIQMDIGWDSVSANNDALIDRALEILSSSG